MRAIAQSHAICRRPRGISLIVVLILMLVMIVVGLAVIRGVTLREKMSSNMLDRSLAFQSAEAALRAGEEAIKTAVASGGSIGVDCSGGASCPIPPAGTYTDTGTGWVNASPIQSIGATTPQYYVQYLGQRTSRQQLSLGYSANSNQYGSGSSAVLQSVYRVIARSQDPTLADGRSVVVLQSNVTVQ
ncbi:PilX protein [Xanthomonas sp. A2111]|uniref:PilX N-terminal domain-containing pilus assembly protein n=1 Tax=Xanthomonas hawaiiensis TaxID=3003247 RepID=A0ABU2I9C1_9XANT|nr:MULTISPECIES: PilX N-terminal domain-containing pilus assembly protein [unclassified Xanthomonas]MBO9827164.1 PilX protein [Xanthomonas sp. A2111]MBO9874040.1 PilX protein [Xanthomonas sp. D-93]MDS9994746.1 PilX N-terminal domain-containing pilus assembly protein [Xanthomonas sp. A2111]WNH46423.1 PilX N-terminal domain-containing pilus assembly protein [Xanthomonas sp. A6251]